MNAPPVLSQPLPLHPRVAEFVRSLGLPLPAVGLPLAEWLDTLPDEDLLDAGMQRAQVLGHVQRLLGELRAMQDAVEPVDRLTLLGGHDKSGQPEEVELTWRAGEVVCIVGPTGAGKSRLLADIECLAQGDTPTGRRVLIDGQVPSAERRLSLDRRLVAQLAQNMNFVVDMTVADFIAMHALCRGRAEPQAEAERVIACANQLAGERFAADIALTQLSGGQTRALMIADMALLSVAPIVLIDEIENAGVDRKRALELLIQGHKIVLISTHDPLLALRGRARIVVRNGGIAEVIETSAGEQRNRARIEALDAVLMDVRTRLRNGQRLDEEIAWPR